MVKIELIFAVVWLGFGNVTFNKLTNGVPKTLHDIGLENEVPHPDFYCLLSFYWGPALQHQKGGVIDAVFHEMRD